MSALHTERFLSRKTFKWYFQALSRYQIYKHFIKRICLALKLQKSKLKNENKEVTCVSIAFHWEYENKSSKF